MSKLQAPESSVAHDSVRRGVEPDLCSVSTGRVKTLYTVVVPCLIEPPKLSVIIKLPNAVTPFR
jgi:hypothetical protein